MNWKFTDSTNTVVCRVNDDGSCESCLFSALPEGTVVEAADPHPLPVLVASKYKLRLALLQFGLLDDVEAFIEATDNRVAKIAWEYADEYRSDDPLAIGLGYALGKTDAEIRAVFELANSL